MKNLILFFVFCTYCICAWGQIKVVQRTELEINKKVGENYKVLNLEENGMLVFVESEEYLKGGRKEIILSKFDTTLQQQWMRAISIDYSSNVGLHYQDGDYLYLLINKEDKEYDILKIHIHGGLIIPIKYERIVKMEISHFAVIDNVLLFGGSVDGRPVVIHHDYINGKPKVLPAINTLKATINRLDICKNDKSIFVLLTPTTNKKKESFYYNIFDIEGKLLNNTAVPYEKDYILYTFQPYFISQNEWYLFGMYSLLAKDKAQGIYVTHIVNNAQEFIKFYDFIYFKNFFNYLAKRKDKVLSKIKGQREEGNIYKHDYNFVIRELKILDDKILFLADSYNPIYRDGINQGFNVNPMFLSAMNMSYRSLININDFMRSPSASRSPVGYKYRHGIVCAFDKTGRLLWDNSLEYKDLESHFQVTPQLQVNMGRDSLTLLNFQDGKIFYKRTDKSTTVEEIKEIEIPLKEEANKLISDRDREAVMSWYGDYFILYGMQQLKAGSSGNSRKVFYLSKLAYFSPKLEEREKKAD
ncbi:hypothetical protein [Thermoflexibacter ruber]|uniref:Uncharacterized protein n=1 Tax=Thermoflexibacter ruber TaxID=1003 RepID=A0A1I2HRE5_9BACT|nr:hypothetical protein [Thermoflexibacter ruber]SFF31286.1 hypothetical protein SAMN04488541_102524 [Thermoflexibacter ruber]